MSNQKVKTAIKVASLAVDIALGIIGIIREIKQSQDKTDNAQRNRNFGRRTNRHGGRKWDKQKSR